MVGIAASGGDKLTDEVDIKALIEEELQKETPDWRRVEALSRDKVEADPENVRFTVDAGHINRLGAELVGKQDTALSELIKNAYDADAASVSLEFSKYDKVGGDLTISDNGSGMTEDVIRSAWMRLSTPSKIDQPLSPRYRRVRAGRKGIGRFSVQRLGEALELETRPRGEELGYRVFFDWDQAFQSGVDLNEVFSRIERFPKAPDEVGTTLKIARLRDAWSTSAISRVWRSVLLLQPPFPVAVKTSVHDSSTEIDPGFSVTINGVSRADKSAEFSIEKTFLPQALATITATIDENGKAEVSVKSDRLQFTDRQAFDERMLVTGPVTLTAYYFIYHSGTLSGMTQAIAAEMGRTYGGVRIYRNGFRVLPYGEPSDDWLELDVDVSRRNLLVPGNNRNFFGQIELNTTTNPLFEETSSREGLLENLAYQELKKFTRQSVEWAAKRIAAFRNRKTSAGQPDFVSEARRPSELIRDLIRNMDRSKAADSAQESAHAALSEVEALAVQFEEKVEKDRAASLEYEEMLRLLASLGLSISVFGHEVKGAKDAMTARLTLLADTIAVLDGGVARTKLEREREKLQKAADRLFDIGGYIAGLMSRTESRELRSLSVLGSLNRFAEQFSEYMRKQGIEFEINVTPQELRTTLMHASELDSVLLNFLTNSIKSMRRGKVAHRKVRMDARAEGAHVVIGFEDNGPGVPVESRGRVFDAFYTTTMAADDDGVAGPGTGLGLKIVADVANSYGGQAAIVEPSEGYGCRFEFRILAAGATA
jgi:signal transduction histidine kinase